jgi:hypothetical protein
MNLDSVITQLKTHCPQLGERVGGAADQALAASNGYLKVPAAYIIPLADDPEASTDSTGLTQRVTESVGVVVVLDNTADRRGQTSANAVEVMKYAVHRALLNFRADLMRSARGLQYEGGSLVDINGARLVWQLVYSHSITITEEDGFSPPSEPLRNIDGHNEAEDGTTTWSFDQEIEHDPV